MAALDCRSSHTANAAKCSWQSVGKLEMNYHGREMCSKSSIRNNVYDQPSLLPRQLQQRIARDADLLSCRSAYIHVHAKSIAGHLLFSCLSSVRIRPKLLGGHPEWAVLETGGAPTGFHFLIAQNKLQFWLHQNRKLWDEVSTKERKIQTAFLNQPAEIHTPSAVVRTFLK